MKKLDLKKIRLVELSNNESNKIVGGDVPWIEIFEFYYWAFTDGASAIGPQNPGANGYMGCKL